MRTNHYINLLAQAEKINRHNRQGSYKTKERYFEAYKRFLRYVGDTYRLEKVANISGKHLSSYIEHMRDKNYAASTVTADDLPWTPAYLCCRLVYKADWRRKNRRSSLASGFKVAWA